MWSLPVVEVVASTSEGAGKVLHQVVEGVVGLVSTWVVEHPCLNGVVVPPS